MRNGYKNYLELQDLLFLADDNKTLFCFSGYFDDERPLKIHFINLQAALPVPNVTQIIEGEIKKNL